MTLAKIASVVVYLAVLFFHLILPTNAYTQAWTPPKGEGTVSLTYQKIDVADHFDREGTKEDRGRIHTHNAIMSLEYGLTDRLALDFHLAYVASKWLGPGRRPHGPLDDGSFHPMFQDAHLEIRYNAVKRPLVITPFIGLSVPTHDYEVRGHVAVGRGFKELVVGTNIGRQLDPILRNGYVHVRYSFAKLKRFEGLNLNRSNVDWEVGWFANESVALRFIGGWQKTHGGFDFPGDIHDDHDFDIHDRVARANYVQLGGGVTYSVNRNFDIHAAYAATVSARNTHGDAGIILGVSWRFSRGAGGRIASHSSSSKLPTMGHGMF